MGHLDEHPPRRAGRNVLERAAFLLPFRLLLAREAALAIPLVRQSFAAHPELQHICCGSVAPLREDPGLYRLAKAIHVWHRPSTIYSHLLMASVAEL